MIVECDQTPLDVHAEVGRQRQMCIRARATTLLQKTSQQLRRAGLDILKSAQRWGQTLAPWLAACQVCCCSAGVSALHKPRPATASASRLQASETCQHARRLLHFSLLNAQLHLAPFAGNCWFGMRARVMNRHMRVYELIDLAAVSACSQA